jgi:hypothetical protein
MFVKRIKHIYEICSDNPSEYGDDDIASDDDNDHHDNDNLDETLILDDSDFFYLQFIIFQNGIFKCYNFVLHRSILKCL